MSAITLTDEQNIILENALKGNNILVDACVGSGKTTVIQKLCNALDSQKKILYLTYNRLLKIDAKSKIRNKNVTVTNYHGFAYNELLKHNIKVGVSDTIQSYINNKPPVSHFDILILDEYQDIDQEISELLTIIKNSNPKIQIIAVGDMEQKIYDKTTLSISNFIKDFLGTYIELKLTKCFRLSSNMAKMLGNIWNKEIIGINEQCDVEEMEYSNVVGFLSKQKTKDILCLGSRTGIMSNVLNELEILYPEKFNKKTVYASISDNDSVSSSTPSTNTAIFTTFDSSKGLERKICIIFDFTEDYWLSRTGKPQQSYEILRNIFCVAASRGKEKIIFVKNNKKLLSEKILKTPTQTISQSQPFYISSMFDFKFKESVEACYNLLNIENVSSNDRSIIDIKSTDELIDLSPCIGIYQEAMFFENHNIDTDINCFLKNNPQKMFFLKDTLDNYSLEEKILQLAAMETNQKRYSTQVLIPFISEKESMQLIDRLKTKFSKDECVQQYCEINFSKNSNYSFKATGYADVIKDDIVYELKFVSELKHEHFLQCACYVVALNLPYGILWNTRDNSCFKITIPEKQKFLETVGKTLNKEKNINLTMNSSNNEIISKEKIAIIDTETNWYDRVMSIGMVIADSSNFDIIEKQYFILEPEYTFEGKYSSQLLKTNNTYITCSRNNAICDIVSILEQHHINKVFAYNAKFDFNHLSELEYLNWYDIMGIAAYKQYNNKISDSKETFKSGRLKKNYGVEPIYRMLSNNYLYIETHNALQDAIDELHIMSLLGHDISYYEHAKVKESGVGSKPVFKKELTLEYTEDSYIFGTTQTSNNTSKSEKRFSEYLDATEVAQVLGISKSKVYKLFREGSINSTKIKNKYSVHRNDLNLYIEEQEKRRKDEILTISIIVISIIIITLSYFFIASGISLLK